MRTGSIAATITLAIITVIAIGTPPAIARDGARGGGQTFSGGHSGSSSLPHGFKQGNKEGWSGKRPPGWSHGEKTGWGKGKIPPGLR